MGAELFQEGWQRELFTVERIIHGKSLSIRCQLEKQAIRLANVRRGEVVAVNRARVAVAKRVEPRDPVADLLPIRNAQRDMMDSAGAIPGTREIVTDG